MNLQVWLSVIAVALGALKAVPGIDPAILNYIIIAEEAISNAVTAVNQAKTTVDPNALQPITPVP